MKKIRLIVALFLLVIGVVGAQELNCTVVINAEQTGQSNLQVFKTLEKSITEFLNETRWTDRSYKNQERIDCSINIIVNEFNTDSFRASIQVQSSRPVYGSAYSTPVFNFNDRQFSFRYTEFQPLVYDTNRYQNNLVSVLSFYAYVILGFDNHTFALDGGNDYFKEAQKVLNTAQAGGEKGWNAADGNNTRFRLMDDVLSANFSDFSKLMFSYHFEGLDKMHQDPKAAKEAIAVALQYTQALYRKRPNNFLTRVFFDAKTEEITSIFKEGPQVKIAELVRVLNRVAPAKLSNWKEIKF